MREFTQVPLLCENPAQTHGLLIPLMSKKTQVQELERTLDEDFSANNAGKWGTDCEKLSYRVVRKTE